MYRIAEISKTETLKIWVPRISKVRFSHQIRASDQARAYVLKSGSVWFTIKFRDQVRFRAYIQLGSSSGTRLGPEVVRFRMKFRGSVRFRGQVKLLQVRISFRGYVQLGKVQRFSQVQRLGQVRGQVQRLDQVQRLGSRDQVRFTNKLRVRLGSVTVGQVRGQEKRLRFRCSVRFRRLGSEVRFSQVQGEILRLGSVGFTIKFRVRLGSVTVGQIRGQEFWLDSRLGSVSFTIQISKILESIRF